MTVAGNVRGLTAAPVSPVPPAPPGAITLIRPGPVRKRRSPVRVPRLARRVVGPLLVLVLWYLACASRVFSSVEMASPLAVADAARELWSQGRCNPTC